MKVSQKEFASADETLEYLVETCLKQERKNDPSVLIFKDPVIDLDVGDFGVTSDRWTRLLRDYLAADVLTFIKGGLPKSGSKSYLAKDTGTMHTKGNCFLGISVARSPNRVTLFSRRSKVCPTGAMDLRLLAHLVELFDAEYGVWYLDSFFSSRLSTLPPLMALGWELEEILPHLSENEREVVTSIQSGNRDFDWKQYERVANALSFQTDENFRKPTGVTIEDIAKHYGIKGVKIRNVIRAELPHIKAPYSFASMDDEQLQEILRRNGIKVPKGVSHEELSLHRNPRRKREVKFGDLVISGSVWE